MTVDDPRARDMLRAYRQHHALGQARGEVLWDRLERSIDRGASEPPVDVATAGARPWHRRPPWIAVMAIAAGVALALTIAPQLAELGVDRPAASQAVHGDRRAEPPQDARIARPAGGVAEVASLPAEVALPGAIQGAASGAAPTVEVDPRRSGGRPRRSPSDAAPSLEDADALVVELGLVRRARRALQDRDPAAALAMLDAHAQAFPNGQMLEDRLALRVEALCATGSEPQAETEAKRLRRLFPRSAHGFDAGKACRSR